ncbi:uncharacterized protein DUF4157 [Streptomyces sp. 1114.5]|uniref:eCIS core domain-containing protein n=1 Tax=Streptomyces sp. 1114.5 TaxID=1938830 RepID=UPI000EB5BB16|nr:DUF4157 domain-containing protein [Streptomyces sp. 1114.5]RKT20018.1 uncharacterized protein DUF4157 [Streptomyces sp. 1114.5]
MTSPSAGPGLAGGGRPLEAGTRDRLSANLRHDFTPVRVHTGPEADAAARALGARAYTVGHDVVFAHGSYDPLTAPGRALIAHELAHVAQHGGRAHAPNLLAAGGNHLPAASAALEQQAEHAAALSERPLPPGWSWQRATAPFLGRAEENPPPATVWQPFTVTYAGQQRTVETVRQLPEDPTVVLVDLGAFVLPREKGPWQKEYQALAAMNAKDGGALQAVTDVSGRYIRAELWERRAPTDELRALWLQRVKWPAELARQWWYEAGGKKQDAGEFRPASQADKTQIDHVIELQLGGTNLPNNLAPHDAKDNMASGRRIWTDLRNAASQVVKALNQQNPDFRPRSLTLRFSDVVQQGTYEAPALETLPVAPEQQDAVIARRRGQAVNSLAVHNTALADLQAGSRPNQADVARLEKAFADRTPYPLSAGAVSQVLRVAPEIRPTVPDPIAGDQANDAARELIPGMGLKSLHRTVDHRHDTVTANFEDVRAGTRLPLAVSPLKGGGDFLLNVVDPGAAGRLAFPDKGKRIEFTYPYLSTGHLDLRMAEEGLVGKGAITPSIPLLNRRPIDVTLDSQGLHASVSPPLDALSLPPFKLTDTSLAISLGPGFTAGGHLGFELARVVTGDLNAEADTAGLFATGTLHATVPGLDRAEAKVRYRPDTGVTGRLDLRATPRAGLVTGGSVVVDFAGGRWGASGEVNLSVLGTPIDLKVARRGDHLVYTGHGTVTVPGLNPFDLRASYDGERVTGSGHTTFTILGLDGEMELGYDEGHFTGKGSIKLKRDRVSGKLEAVLDREGRISGKGEVELQIRPGLVGRAAVLLSPDQLLRVEGELRFPPYRFLEPRGNRYQIFDIPFPEIPLFAVPLGPVSLGLVAQLSAAAAFRYSFGPGEIRDLVLSAAFNPLEADTDLKVGAKARLVLPAEAGLELRLRAAAGLSAGVASITGGISVTGGVLLRGGLNAEAELVYARKVLAFHAQAQIKVQPVLTLAITADITAKARLLGEKSWPYELAAYAFDTGLEFGLIAPFDYESDKPLRLPEAKDIQWITPKIDVLALAGQITDRVRSGLKL